MKLINDENSRELVKFALNTKENLNIENSSINGIHYIVTSPQNIDKKYGIIIRYRNIPESETCSQVFKDLETIKKNCNNSKLIPTIAFVLNDETEKYAYVFLFTVKQLEDLADSEIIKDEISYVEHGIQIKYGINNKTIVEMLDKLKEHLDYIEIKAGGKDFAKLNSNRL